MKKIKIGALFIMTILALAGIGVSYAGFFDTIYVYGTVDTATVDLTIEDYSGTDVWKVWMNDGTPPPTPYEEEVFIWRGFFDDRFTEAEVITETGADNALLVASAWATPDGVDYDVDMVWDDVFPCIDFTADVILHYDGSIPAKISLPTIIWRMGDDLSQYVTFNAYEYTFVNQEWLKGAEIQDWPFQIHFCEYVGIEVTIHIPQENILQDKHGEFSFDINALQWNDECGDTDLTIIKTVDNNAPYIGTNIEYTIEVTNNGPLAASNIVVEDILPPDLTYVAPYTATKGTYDPNTGLWTIGDLGVGDTEYLYITALVTNQGTYQGHIQLGLILDGSGSINSAEWTLIKTGVTTAINDINIFPESGIVELTVVQFSTTAAVVVPPTIITAATKPGVITAITNMVQMGSLTNIGAGFTTCANAMIGGAFNDPTNRQIINLVTDGDPTSGSPDPTTAAINGRNYAINLLGMTTNQDEIDAEGIGIDQSSIDWLRYNIVYPQTGNEAPPFIPGWVLPVANFDQFASAIGEKFGIIFTSIENCAEIISQTPADLTPNDNIDCVTITPQPCIDPEFTNIDLETSLDESTWNDVYYDGGAGYFVLDVNGLQGVDHYLNLGDATTSNIPLAEGYHDLYLDVSSVPANFYSYWNGRGVYSGCPGTWEPLMWTILDNSGPTNPIVKIKVTDNGDGTYTHMLVDGLHFLLGTVPDQYFRLPDDYPPGTYHVSGSITSVCGLTNTLDVYLHVALTPP